MFECVGMEVEIRQTKNQPVREQRSERSNRRKSSEKELQVDIVCIVQNSILVDFGGGKVQSKIKKLQIQAIAAQ